MNKQDYIDLGIKDAVEGSLRKYTTDTTWQARAYLVGYAEGVRNVNEFNQDERALPKGKLVQEFLRGMSEPKRIADHHRRAKATRERHAQRQHRRAMAGRTERLTCRVGNYRAGVNAPARLTRSWQGSWDRGY